MNWLSNTLSVYVELGLILVLAYLMLRAVRRLLQSRIEPARMIGIGRVLFAVTLVSPLAAHGLLSLPGAAPNGAGGAASTTVDELAERLRGLSGLLSSRLDGAASDPAGSIFGLDPLWMRTASLVLAALLLAGLTLAVVRVVRHVRELRTVVRTAVPLRRLGRVSIVVSERASVPFSTAIFGRAHVVLPVELLQDSQVLRLSLRHELQHYRRRDPLWSMALELFRVVYFWNPAARGWMRELSDLQELACDEAVIRRGVPAEDYGNCLLRVAEMAVARRVVASTAMATTSDRGAHLRRRIDMLFRDRALVSSRAWAFGLTTFCSSLLVLAATTAAANRPAATPDANAAAVPAGDAGHHHGPDCDPADCDPVPEKAIAESLPDLEFESPSGATVSLSELEGSVVVVEFWAAWCKYCQREVTHMKALHELLGNNPDFELVGVSLSRSPEETEQFLDEHEVGWPQLHAADGWKSEAVRAFGVTGVPSRYLIDRDGRATMLPRGDAERLAQLVLEAIEGERVTAAIAR